MIPSLLCTSTLVEYSPKVNDRIITRLHHPFTQKILQSILHGTSCSITPGETYAFGLSIFHYFMLTLFPRQRDDRLRERLENRQERFFETLNDSHFLQCHYSIIAPVLMRVCYRYRPSQGKQYVHVIGTDEEWSNVLTKMEMLFTGFQMYSSVFQFEDHVCEMNQLRRIGMKLTSDFRQFIENRNKSEWWSTLLQIDESYQIQSNVPILSWMNPSWN